MESGTLGAVPAGAPLALRFELPAGAPAPSRLRAWVAPAAVAGRRGGASLLQPVRLQREATVLVDRRRGQVAVPNGPSGAHGRHESGQGLAQTMPAGGYAAAASISAGARATALDPGGRLLAAIAPAGGKVELVDLLGGKTIGAIAVGGRPSTLRFAPDGRLWISDVSRGRVSVADPAAARVVGTVRTGAATGAPTFGPDGRRALVTGRGGVAVVDARTLRVVAGAKTRSAAVGAGWSAAERTFVVGTEDGVATRVGLDGRTRGSALALGLSEPVRLFALAPGGRQAVAVGRDGKLVVADLRRARVSGRAEAGEAPEQLDFLGRFALVRRATAASLTWVDVTTPSRSNAIPLARPATDLAIAPGGRKALLASPADQKLLGLHVMMGRPMLMQADPNTARSDDVLVAGGGLQRTGRRTYELRTALTVPGRHRLELGLGGGARARFSLRVGAPAAAVAVRSERRHYAVKAGAPLAVRFRVAGPVPRDAEVQAFATGTAVSQLRSPARAVAPGLAEARLRLPAPGRYRLRLRSEQVDLDTGLVHGTTVKVTP